MLHNIYLWIKLRIKVPLISKVLLNYYNCHIFEKFSNKCQQIFIPTSKIKTKKIISRVFCIKCQLHGVHFNVFAKASFKTFLWKGKRKNVLLILCIEEKKLIQFSHILEIRLDKCISFWECCDNKALENTINYFLFLIWILQMC